MPKPKKGNKPKDAVPVQMRTAAMVEAVGTERLDDPSGTDKEPEPEA